MRLKADGKTLLDLVSVPGEPTPPLVAAIDATSMPGKFTLPLVMTKMGTSFWIPRDASTPTSAR